MYFIKNKKICMYVFINKTKQNKNKKCVKNIFY